MRYKLFCASCMMAAAVVGAAPAYAAPAGPAECGSAGGGGEPAATSYPGNSATSPGSIFNEPTEPGGLPGISPSGGKGNQAYNNAGAPSQYDRACGRVTANNTGTPYPTTPSQMDITNNSRAARDALLGVGGGHIGKGQTK
jgi:hypothetical protein